jgi:hypothetical protein
MDNLYREAWQQLSADREALAEIEREATPVLVFGQWQTSRFATAGLNPSEIEFRDRLGQALAGSKQRFLHWPADGQLTEERLQVARERAEQYFTLGNTYTRWFDLYTAFLAGAGVSFKDGAACHTDYISPFATHVGISKCSRRVQLQLPAYGQQLWTRVLEAMPQLQIVFGHGAGYRTMPGLLKFAGWQPLPTEFDRKGGNANIARPYLLFARVNLPNQQRNIGLYWWKPNRDGSPLTWLNPAERAHLGAYVRTHAIQQGLWTDTLH